MYTYMYIKRKCNPTMSYFFFFFFVKRKIIIDYYYIIEIENRFRKRVYYFKFYTYKELIRYMHTP